MIYSILHRYIRARGRRGPGPRHNRLCTPRNTQRLMRVPTTNMQGGGGCRAHDRRRGDMDTNTVDVEQRKWAVATALVSSHQGSLMRQTDDFACQHVIVYIPFHAAGPSLTMIPPMPPPGGS
eukprot:6424331-Prymnesium_polylepis.1